MSREHDPARQDGTGSSSQDGSLLDEYLTRPEMARALNIGERTLAGYDALGEGPPPAPGGWSPKRRRRGP